MVWRLAWFVLMPLILIYLWRRGKGDPMYRQEIGARFGRHTKQSHPHIWVHAVSIGELRSAVPIIRAFLDQGERVVTTHFTPAGLREARRIFDEEIKRGHLTATYVPFDYGLAMRRFFRAFSPKFGLVMEVEFWPGMITATRAAGVPLYLCNGQYPGKSFARDRDRWLSPALLVPGFAGVMVKSELQAERFRHFGQTRIALTGEMRFEQPIPGAQVAAAETLRHALANGRRVITLASVVEWEEELFTSLIADWPKTDPNKPFFVYVPRAPERFDTVAEGLKSAGVRAVRRSEVLTETLEARTVPGCDVLIGDSLGEMYFYLSLGDLAVAGGGFNPRGSHNIIEPLALGKPVIVGPQIWTIEYPAVEAIHAGVAQQVTGEDLKDVLSEPVLPSPEAIESFLGDHAGAVAKTLATLEGWG